MLARSMLVVFIVIATSTAALTAEAGSQSSLPAAVCRTVAVSADGRISGLGGHDVEGGLVTAVEAFDPTSGVARRAGYLVYQAHGAAAANVDGKILVFGGASRAVHDVVQQFFPSSGKGRVVGSMPTVRADLTAAVVGRRAILVGGFDGVGPQSAVWATGDGRRLTVVASLPQPVRYRAVAALGHTVYVFGG